jgi:MFS family permease
VGLLVLIAADAALAWSGHWSWVWLGISLRGLHMGMTQGLFATMVADAAPADLRGTAYGFFSLTSGLAMLLASTVAGLVWERLGAPFTFVAGAGFGAVTLLVIATRTVVTRREER